ncbi:ComF family protein [Candidatus Parcubacteria bacterium]|nr:MAG: ComF family protein [Candidatus Parcubacteria bacterium]
MKSKSLILSIKNYLLDVLFPKQCLGCKKEGFFLCQDCIVKISSLSRLVCPVCLKGLPTTDLSQAKCNTHFKKTKIKFLAYTTFYENPLVRKLVSSFKYRYIQEISSILSKLMAENLKQYKLEGFIIVPVPLYPKKLNERGFNQAELLAKDISSSLDLPMENVLQKIKSTPSQTELSSKERKLNPKDAFLCFAPERIRGKNIILVDDVFTTGATLEECAKTLKQYGVKIIGAVVFAR